LKLNGVATQGAPDFLTESLNAEFARREEEWFLILSGRQADQKIFGLAAESLRC
jgi:hypothetical protein